MMECNKTLITPVQLQFAFHHMAALIPAIGTCRFDSRGERRLAERLEQKLCDKYRQRLLFNVRKRSGDYNPSADAVQIMTMKVSKGLEFPVVALPGMGHMPAPGEDEKEAARVFYVAATRATQRLAMGVGGEGSLRQRLILRSVDLGSTAVLSASQLHQIYGGIQ